MSILIIDVCREIEFNLQIFWTHKCLFRKPTHWEVMYFSNFCFCEMLKQICWEPIWFSLLDHSCSEFPLTRFDMIRYNYQTSSRPMPSLKFQSSCYVYSIRKCMNSCHVPTLNIYTILITAQINLCKYSNPIVLKV